MENKVGQPLGRRQIEIAELLLKHKRPFDAEELAKLFYGPQPTKTKLNIVWSALNGMEKRGMVAYVSKTFRGFRRWELTKQGRKDMEILKSTKNVVPLVKP